jgi:hypothetical protein
MNRAEINYTLKTTVVGGILVYSKLNVKLSFGIFGKFPVAIERLLGEEFTKRGEPKEDLILSQESAGK